MSENATDTSAAGGPSLEQILWRAMDRWKERPALVDSEEFAAHIEGVFQGDIAAEAWVARFFEGAEKLHQAPADMAEAIVRATSDRLHVYEFDLKRLEYVIVEDEEKVIVVSDFGQFALSNDDMVTRAIEAAVIPAGKPGSTRSAGALDRGGAEPKAYFVRASGEVVAVDVKKVARSLEQLLVRQVSMPSVDKLGARMLPFAPTRRALTGAREAQVLRQDARTRQAVPAAPRLARPADAGTPAAPTGVQTALFLLMPDGTLARPEMGSATRWQQMVGNYARSASAAVPVTHGQRITVQAGNVVTIINMGGLASSTVGERALARSENISAVRADSAPIHTLGDDDLARALAAGAMVVPGLARADKFWIQPEAAFRPDEKALSQGGMGAPKGAVVSQPLQLGEITGDPWADWALTGGGEMSPEAMLALRGRSRHVLRATLDSGGDEMSVAPELAQKLRGVRGKNLALAGGQVVAFRAPDGSLVMQRGAGAIRLAALDRPDALQPIDLQLPGTGAPLASRSGALPANALAALQMALEHTANAGGYKMPMLRLESARDALDVGAAMELESSDTRRTTVRLAGPTSIYDGGAGNQVAQLLLSMPFPNNGEVHVGGDLSEALQAYLGAAVQPASGRGAFGSMALGGAAGAGAGGVIVRLRGGSGGLAGEGDLVDWGGLHTQAIGRAQDSVITLDLPMVQPLVTGSSSVSGLPALLQRALAQSGDWTPGPGAAVPTSIRDFALRGPFDVGQGGLPDLVAAMPQTRPLNPGEEEIVIPMPLWAQMGRGQLSDTDQIMASPLAPAGYAPPMGVYRLVVPAGGPVDMTGGAPPGTDGILELAGPTGLELVVRPNQSSVSASSLGGRQLLGRVAIDDGETAVTRRGRIRIGAPLSDAPAQKLFTPSDSVNVPSASEFQPGQSVLLQGGSGANSAPTVVSGARPSMPSVDVPSGTYIDGTYSGAAASSGSSGGSPMAGALTSAMQMSNDVSARTSMPGRPAIGQGATSSPALTSDSSGFSARAQAAGQQSAGSASLPTSSSGATGSAASSSGSGSSASGGGSLDSSGGSDQTLVATAVEGSVAGAQAGSAVSDMVSSSSSARRAADSAGDSSSSPSFITGLQPGMWSGHRRNQTRSYQSWSYSSNNEDRSRSAGGVDLSSLSRPIYPSLPTSLRFRYVGAPLWWSGSSRGGIGASDGGGEETDSTPANRAMRAGLRAATSAASIWRSILVASPQWGGPQEDLSGGMDSGHDANADEMSSLSRRFDALTAASVVGGGAAGAGAGAAYVGISGSGAAGTLTKSAAGRARADSIQMSIVAAIPPAPPPLESMGSGMTGGNAPHARGKGHGHGGGGQNQNKEGSDSVSHSKIEGSVDAIAQRIYHRIRRRIQSDRERFGG